MNLFARTILGLALTATALAQSDVELFREGTRLPRLTLPTLQGDRVMDLAELAPGRKVLLLQFASW